jgi:hypothetical protein
MAFGATLQFFMFGYRGIYQFLAGVAVETVRPALLHLFSGVVGVAFGAGNQKMVLSVVGIFGVGLQRFQFGVALEAVATTPPPNPNSNSYQKGQHPPAPTENFHNFPLSQLFDEIIIPLSGYLPLFKMV